MILPPTPLSIVKLLGFKNWEWTEAHYTEILKNFTEVTESSSLKYALSVHYTK